MSGIYGSNQRDNADRKSKQLNCINYIKKYTVTTTRLSYWATSVELHQLYGLSYISYIFSVGFLPGRKVFLPHEGEKQGRTYFCHSFCHFCRGERAELIKI